MIKNRYTDLIEQTFYFPRHGFDLKNFELSFHDIPLMELIKEYGTPLKFTYLPKIGMQIQKAKQYFADAIEKYNYNGFYKYCYCTKSSHFSYIIEEALKNDTGLETSSAYDLDIIRSLHQKGLFPKNREIICNGYKTEDYARKIVELVNDGFENLITILDNPNEIDLYDKYNTKLNLGVRIATEEEPNSVFYTSRLGISSKKVIELYNEKIKNNPNYSLKMMHFFVNTGIKDTTYYWSELSRLINFYCELKKAAPELEGLDIGGGMPIYTSLGVEHDYAYMIDQIVMYIKTICDDSGVPVPNIYSEFGQYTVGESGGTIYSVIGQKEQNDKEMWYMIDSSFITTLPDTWGIGQKFILLAINMWDRPFQRINLGGITCDGQDYYNSDTHTNQVFMPVIKEGETLYMGFFHTGAYQESIGGYGGIQHCLIPAPKHIIIDKVDGELTYKVFSTEQSAESMMKLLGY
jgi:arginine decarboxylase